MKRKRKKKERKISTRIKTGFGAGSKSSFNQRTVPGSDLSFWLTWGYGSSFGMNFQILEPIKPETHQGWFITVVINYSPNKYHMSPTYKVSSSRVSSQLYLLIYNMEYGGRDWVVGEAPIQVHSPEGRAPDGIAWHSHPQVFLNLRKSTWVQEPPPLAQTTLFWIPSFFPMGKQIRNVSGYYVGMKLGMT